MDKLKKISVLLLAILPPLYINFHFDGKYLFIIVLSLLLSLFLTYRTNIFQLILSILVIILIYVSIIIIPFSFYSNWLLQLKENIPNGRITNLIISIWIFSYIYNCLNIKNDKYSIIKCIILSLTIVFILFNLYSFLIIIPILFILYSVLRKIKLGLNVIVKASIVFVLVLVLSINLSSFFPAKGSESVNNLSYNIRNFLIKKFPNIDILTTIPGSEGISKSRGKPPILTSNKLFKLWGNPGETYYLRMAIESKDDNVRYLDSSELKKAKVNSVKLQVLSDYLPVIPTLNNGIFNQTVVPITPLSRNDIFYIEKSNDKSFFLIDNYYSDAGFTNNSIKTLANSLKGENDNQTLKNIENYLKVNYAYSTETENKENYIDDFLFKTKKGFCVHFARSFIILARLNNLSAREVSGYHINIKRPENEVYKGFTYVTGKNSHMWPEVYIDGKWITYEVTPGYYINNKKTMEQKNIPIIDRKVDSLVIKSRNTPLRLIIISSMIFLTVIVLIIILLNKDPIKRMLSKTKKQGIKHPSDIGWIEWNLLTFNTLEHKDLFLEYSYKKRALSKEDKAKLKKLSRLVSNNFHNPA